MPGTFTCRRKCLTPTVPVQMILGIHIFGTGSTTPGRWPSESRHEGNVLWRQWRQESKRNLREEWLIKEKEGEKTQLHNIFLYISVIASNCKTEISVAPSGVTWSTSNFQCIQLERGIERCILHLSTSINSGSVRDFLNDEVTPMLCLY